MKICHLEKLKEYIVKSDIKSMLDASWTGIKSKKDEVECIKEYLTEKNVGVDFINQKLEAIESDYLKMRIKSVFSHKQPRVTFSDKNKQSMSCELADILFIYRVNDEGYTGLYSAGFLCQAKLNHKGNKNEKQECLYNEVTEFTMPKWAEDNQIRRRFTEKGKSLSFLYLDEYKFKKINEHKESDFSDVFLDFLIGDFGLQFDAEINNGKYSILRNSDWNILMNDLITKVGQNNYPGKSYKKLTEFLTIGNDSDSIELDNANGDTDEHEFPSMIIVDIDFNRKLRMEMENLINR